MEILSQNLYHGKKILYLGKTLVSAVGRHSERLGQNAANHLLFAVFKMENRELKFDRLPETLSQVGVRKTQWYAMVARGDAPQPVRLGGRAVAWERSEVQAWMRTRLEASRRPSGK